MSKNPVAVTLVCLVLAIAVNIYYFSSGTELTSVVAKTLFADLILVLSLVPVYQAIVIKNTAESVLSFPERIKSGLKPVAMYTLVVALVTFALIKFFGETLIAERLAEISINMQRGVETGAITQEVMDGQIELAKQIYSPSSHVIIVLIFNLFVGFLSSIIAAFLVRK